MVSESKVTQLISELTRQTVKGSLTWSVTSAPRALEEGTNNVVPLYFETTLKGQKVGLAQKRHQIYIGEHDRYIWEETIVLAFVDDFRRVVWEHSEPSSALFNLLDVVREKSADVDGILGKLLQGDSDE
jgi:hypothetical protein